MPAAAVKSTITVDLNNRIASTGTEQKASNMDSGTVFTIDFRQMIQTNAKTGFQRKVCRLATPDVQSPPPLPQRTNKLYRPPPPPVPPPTLDLPALPDDIKLVGERAQSMLQARRGQIVQVSKENATSEWLYGNVIYDPHGSSAA